MPISGCHDLPSRNNLQNKPNSAATLWRHACLTTPEGVKESPSDIGATSKEKNNIVIPEFSAWLTLVLEQCRAENIRNLPRQRAPTPLFPERRPREACSMPISGCHDLPLVTFNLPSRNNLQNKPNSAATLWRHACLTTPEHVKESPNPPNPSCCRSRGGMRGWPLPRPTHAPATYARTTGTRHTREKTRTPHAAAPAAACSRNNPQNKRQQRPFPPQNNPSCLAGPPANTCSRNNPQNKRQQRPSPPQNNPSCRHSVAACVSDHSRGQALPPATAPSPTAKESPPVVIPEFSFRASGRKISGISAARRGIPPELRMRCREATAREGRGGVAIFF